MKEVFEGEIKYRVIEKDDVLKQNDSDLFIETVKNGKRNTLVFRNCGPKDKICILAENLIESSVDFRQIQILLEDFDT